MWNFFYKFILLGIDEFLEMGNQLVLICEIWNLDRVTSNISVSMKLVSFKIRTGASLRELWFFMIKLTQTFFCVPLEKLLEFRLDSSLRSREHMGISQKHHSTKALQQNF